MEGEGDADENSAKKPQTVPNHDDTDDNDDDDGDGVKIVMKGR